MPLQVAKQCAAAAGLLIGQSASPVAMSDVSGPAQSGQGTASCIAEPPSPQEACDSVALAIGAWRAIKRTST